MHLVQVKQIKKPSKYKSNKDKVNNNYKTAAKKPFICDPTWSKFSIMYNV